MRQRVGIGLLTTVLAIVISGCAAGEPDALPGAEANDQRAGAGRMVDGTLRLRLVVRLARLSPEADSGPQVTVSVFGEESKAPQVPGPLVRVPMGTRVKATVRNELADTVAVIGLGGPERGGRDTLWLAPGSSDSTESTASAPGTYAYYGRTVTGGQLNPRRPGEQLFGAFVVDSSGTRPDRIVVIDDWSGKPVAGADTPFVMMLNGKSWPYTERLDLGVGDTLRLRVINGSESEHPMHLHGFYYRVDAHGTWHADTSYAEADRRLVVTEPLRARETMALSWVPDRPGNWLFHCHVAFHIAGVQHDYLAGRVPSDTVAHAGPDHLERDMAGLVMGIRVSGAAPPAGPSRVEARQRIVVASQATNFPDRTPAYGYAIGASEGRIPAEPLLLTRGVRTAITVVNRLPVPTSVHWHGIELESYYDGVAGWSGAGQRLAPIIVPGDSFVAVMTPPRSGTFIFHAHVDDQRQLASGLVGPLLVLDPGTRRDPTRDQIWLFSQAGTSDSAPIVVNGGRPVPALRGGVQRIRVINITAGDELDLQLLRDERVDAWRAIAKDGADLPPSQATVRPARLHLGPGETWDFEWRPKPGRYRLAVKSFNDFETTITVR